jgi:RNA polymerase sigma factor (sigma-70 family)
MTSEIVEFDAAVNRDGPLLACQLSTDPPVIHEVRNWLTDVAVDEYVGSDERNVLRRLKAGDTATWTSIVEEHQRRLGALGRSYRLSPQEVEDAVQTTWLLLLMHADEIRDPVCLGAWLAATMRHECLRLFRGRRNELVGDWGTREPEAPSAEEPEARLEDLEAALERKQLGAELWGLLDELPPRQRDLLRTLCGADEPSYAEVSARTGLPVGAIGPTRQRALRRLRELCEGTGLRVA